MIDNTDALGDTETENAVAAEVGELVEEMVEDAVASEATIGAQVSGAAAGDRRCWRETKAGAA